MRLLPLFAVLLLATGCTYSRAEYESQRALPVLAEFTLPNGDTRVVYGPDSNPEIDLETGVYTCQEGIRIADYRGGVLVRRWFQEHSQLKP